MNPPGRSGGRSPDDRPPASRPRASDAGGDAVGVQRCRCTLTGTGRRRPVRLVTAADARRSADRDGRRGQPGPQRAGPAGGRRGGQESGRDAPGRARVEHPRSLRGRGSEPDGRREVGLSGRSSRFNVCSTRWARRRLAFRSSWSRATLTRQTLWSRRVRTSHLLVLGRHDPAIPIGSHLGPVARAVLRDAACPVLLADPRPRTHRPTHRRSPGAHEQVDEAGVGPRRHTAPPSLSRRDGDDVVAHRRDEGGDRGAGSPDQVLDVAVSRLPVQGEEPQPEVVVGHPVVQGDQLRLVLANHGADRRDPPVGQEHISRPGHHLSVIAHLHGTSWWSDPTPGLRGSP